MREEDKKKVKLIIKRGNKKEIKTAVCAYFKKYLDNSVDIDYYVDKLSKPLYENHTNTSNNNKFQGESRRVALAYSNNPGTKSPRKDGVHDSSGSKLPRLI